MKLDPRVLQLAALLEELSGWLGPELDPVGGSTVLPVRETRELAEAVRHARFQLRGTLLAAGLPAGPAPPRTVADLIREHRQRLSRTTSPTCRRLG